MLWPRKFSRCLSTFTSSQLNSAHRTSKIPYVRESLAKFRKDTSTGAIIVYSFNIPKGLTVNIHWSRNLRDILDKKVIMGFEINPYTCIDNHDFFNF